MAQVAKVWRNQCGETGLSMPASLAAVATSLCRRFGDWLHLRLSGPRDVSLALPAVEASYRYVQAGAASGRRRRK
jgi:hypothetical protein